MSSLQEATYYAALIFCSVMLLALLGGIIALLVIKRKVTKAKRSIEEKINIVSHLPYIGKHVFKAIKGSMK